MGLASVVVLVASHLLPLLLLMMPILHVVVVPMVVARSLLSVVLVQKGFPVAPLTLTLSPCMCLL